MLPYEGGRGATMKAGLKNSIGPRTGQLKNGPPRLVDPLLIANGGLKEVGTFKSHPVAWATTNNDFSVEDIKFVDTD
ncbi:MAG: hypothetical protein M1816_003036 [Peltula sp. TS41687]|nr:MAG: hypothetical protein M1816_003036 [Peltula sp. TS41687]